MLLVCCFKGYSVKRLHVQRCFFLRCHKHHTLCLLSHLRTATSKWSWILVMTAPFPTRFDLQGCTSRQLSKKRLDKKWENGHYSHYTLHLHFTCTSPNLKQILRCQVNWRIKKWLQNVHHLEFDGEKAFWQWPDSRICCFRHRIWPEILTFCHRMAAVNRNITSLGALAFSEALEDESEEVRRDFQLWRSINIPIVTLDGDCKWFRISFVRSSVFGFFPENVVLLGNGQEDDHAAPRRRSSTAETRAALRAAGGDMQPTRAERWLSFLKCLVVVHVYRCPMLSIAWACRVWFHMSLRYTMWE